MTFCLTSKSRLGESQKILPISAGNQSLKIFFFPLNLNLILLMSNVLEIFSLKSFFVVGIQLLCNILDN